MEKKTEQKHITFIDVNHAIFKEHFFETIGS